MTNLPATVQLSTLSQEITALTNRLAPASEDAVTVALGSLQTAGLTIPASIEPGNVMRVYRFALEGVPTCGLKIATKKLLRGDYAGNPDILLGMVPKPPVLAALAKLEARTAREDLARKRDLVETLTHKVPEIDRSPEVMARVRARVAEVRSAAAAERSKTIKNPEPTVMTEEAAEYWRKIQALNDVPGGLTAEEAAYRRKIEAMMPSTTASDETTEIRNEGVSHAA